MSFLTTYLEDILTKKTNKQTKNRLTLSLSLWSVQNEVEVLVQNLAHHRAAPVDIGYYLSSATANVICSLLMSVRFRHNDPRFLRFTELIDEGFRLFTNTAIAGFIPILRYLPGFSCTYNQIRKVWFHLEISVVWTGIN